MRYGSSSASTLSDTDTSLLKMVDNFADARSKLISIGTLVGKLSFDVNIENSILKSELKQIQQKNNNFEAELEELRKLIKNKDKELEDLIYLKDLQHHS